MSGVKVITKYRGREPYTVVVFPSGRVVEFTTYIRDKAVAIARAKEAASITC